ncbi:ABC transporter permease [Streptococcus sciuri]|uniref:ABC transporter permease n=1 Tax=Streptococcus sciuri TaxID=2973939 RepID=A0ABT2F7B2_9STRE|nr:ABC transporter permease [Streptococcus sciuri]MCS4488287.1 ABC transporter permease [Streptococcus sciuri]
MGNADCFSDFNFHHSNVLTKSQLKVLLEHEDSKKTIGLDEASRDTLYALPRPLFTTPIVIDRLEQVYKKSNTLTGIYHVNGLKSETDKSEFIKQFANNTGLSKENFLKEKFGSHRDYGLVPFILLGLLLFTMLTLLIVLLVIVLQAYETFGSLILLGWSRNAFWSALFKPIIYPSLLSTPVLAVGVWWLTGWSQVSYSILIPIMGHLVFSMLALATILIVPSLIVYSVTALSVLSKRFPSKLLTILGISSYLALSGILIATSYSLDAPLYSFMDNIHIARAWKNVENMQIIDSFSEGDDLGTLAGTSNTLESSMYHLYTKIGHDKGVYLIHSQYYGQDFLTNVTAYQNLPSKPFWYLVYSYNYLTELGFRFSKEELNQIRNGSRLYLIPDSYTSDEQKRMQAYLKESVKVYEGDVETPFTQNRQFVFKNYSATKDIFLWSTNLQQGVTSKDPIIFVASPENLYFIESANLIVSGFNGYLKIDNQRILTRVKKEITTHFPDLMDNAIQFTPVRRYIDGRQKELSYTFYLFGSVILAILMSLTSILTALVLIYRITYQERLMVQYFLGFSSWTRYKGIMILMIATAIIEALISFLLKTKLGIVSAALSLCLQSVLLYGFLLRKEQQKILSLFKE